MDSKTALTHAMLSSKTPGLHAKHAAIDPGRYSLLTLRACPFWPSFLENLWSQLGNFRVFSRRFRALMVLQIFLKSFRLTAKVGPMTLHSVTPLTPAKAAPDIVHFHRTELSLIMSLYGRMVAAGEWRDYGMAGLRDVAVFSIFRRTAEHALYRIEKRPKLAAKQGMYAIIGMDGRILRRGHDLKSVLRVLERKLIRSVD